LNFGKTPFIPANATDKSGELPHGILLLSDETGRHFSLPMPDAEDPPAKEICDVSARRLPIVSQF
jgi:hypothetical protein